MRIRNILLVIGLAGSFVGRSFAEDRGWAYTGIGQFSCGTYSLAFQGGSPSVGLSYLGQQYFSQAGAFSQWVAGYVSGINMGHRSSKNQITTDLDGMAMSVKKICDQHPDWSVLQAASFFAKPH
jgi:hypothetical protein